MKVYVIIMQDVYLDEKERLRSTQCYGSTFTSEKEAKNFLIKNGSTIFKNKIVSVRPMEVDLFNGYAPFSRDILYTISIAANFKIGNLENPTLCTDAYPTQRDALDYLKYIAYDPNKNFETKDLHIVEQGNSNWYYESSDGEQKVYLQIDRLIFKDSDKIGFVL